VSPRPRRAAQGALAQCRRALRPDGLLLAAMFGGETLQELRIACAVAQQEREGGISPFVSPLAQVWGRAAWGSLEGGGAGTVEPPPPTMAGGTGRHHRLTLAPSPTPTRPKVRDAGNLLTRADLALPTVDVDNFVLNYPSPGDLVTHLRAMGEGSALAARRRGLSRGLALAAAAAYQGMFPAQGGEGVAATYQVRRRPGAGVGRWAAHGACCMWVRPAGAQTHPQPPNMTSRTATLLLPPHSLLHPPSPPPTPTKQKVMYLTGWSPDKNQPKAAKRGSATVSFHELAEYLEAAQPDTTGSVPPPGAPGGGGGKGAGGGGGAAHKAA
jgi:hypothetical protein